MATPLTTPEIAARVRRVLDDHGRLHVAGGAVGEHEDLYGAGMNSHASINVMVALEHEFGVEFPDQMLNRGTFDTIASICTAVQSLLV